MLLDSLLYVGDCRTPCDAVTVTKEGVNYICFVTPIAASQATYREPKDLHPVSKANETRVFDRLDVCNLNN